MSLTSRTPRRTGPTSTAQICRSFGRKANRSIYWTGFIDEMKIGAVMDLSPGSGALLEAALSRGILYYGLCRNRSHMNWLQGIADRATCGLIATQGSGFLVAE